MNKVVKDFDVLIDFSSPKNTINNLLFCRKHSKMMVIGTTGFDNVEKKIIKDISKYIGIVLSPNFSIGINLLIQLAEKTAKTLGNYSDIEIIETHHRNKLDAPSGTALYIGEKISHVLKYNFNDHAIFSRNNLFCKRKKNGIGFSSIRAGKIVGEHNVMFVSDNESIEIKHQAFNRIAFSDGALYAAYWIKNMNHGLYDMQDVLN